MRIISLSIIVLFTSISTSYADFQCPSGQPAWHAQDRQGADYYLYGTQGFEWKSKLYLERWDNGSLTWRVSPERTCSNGISICYINFPGNEENQNEHKNEDAQLSVSYETISDDQVADKYIVIAALTQSAWYTGGINVERFNKIDIEQERIIAPNVYTKINCDKLDNQELVFLKAANIATQKAKFEPDELLQARLIGKLKSMYDCIPETRKTCLEMLYKDDAYMKQHKDEYEISEWGEWHDTFDNDIDRNKFWEDLHRHAAEEGYNLFTNAELQEAVGVKFDNK